MTTIDHLLRRLSDMALWLGAIAIIAMMAHVTADVLFKISFNWPIMGTLEIVSFVYMVSCTFLPLPHVMLTKSLIVVELFTQNMRPRALLKLETLMAPLSIAYLGVLAVMGTGRAWNKTMLGETQDATYFELPVWPMRWVFAGACAIAALITIYQFIDDIRLLRTGKRFDGRGEQRLGDITI